MLPSRRAYRESVLVGSSLHSCSAKHAARLLHCRNQSSSAYIHWRSVFHIMVFLVQDKNLDIPGTFSTLAIAPSHRVSSAVPVEQERLAVQAVHRPE